MPSLPLEYNHSQAGWPNQQDSLWKDVTLFVLERSGNNPPEGPGGWRQNHSYVGGLDTSIRFSMSPQTYFTVHIEVPVHSPSPVQERVSIIGDASVHQALRVQVGTHGLSLSSSCHPGHAQVVQHLCTLERGGPVRQRHCLISRRALTTN